MIGEEEHHRPSTFQARVVIDDNLQRQTSRMCDKRGQTTACASTRRDSESEPLEDSHLTSYAR